MRAVVLFAVIGLGACEGGGDPVQQALREESAANHAEVALARAGQAERRAAETAARQAEIDRLRREIAVAEAALSTGDADVRAAAQASLDEKRRALAALDGGA